MAAPFAVDEVREMVLNSDAETDDEKENEREEEERQTDDPIESRLGSFPAPEGFNRELFMDIWKEIIIIQQCS